MIKVSVSFILAAMLIFLIVPQPVLADTPGGNGEIDGSMVNGTAGGATIGSLTVHLSVYLNNAVADVKIATTGDDGKFTFTQLPTDPSYSFEAAAVYQTVQYTSDFFSFDSGQTIKPVQLNVYETTSESVPVSDVMAHAILSYAAGSLQIMEFHFFNNDTDRAYLGQVVDNASGRRETLKLSLPVGATGLQVDPSQPDYLTVNGSELSYGAPLVPGTNQIIFSYIIPFSSDSYTLAWKVNYSISRFDLLFLNQNLRVSGAKLTQEQPLSIDGSNYQDYSSQNLVPGDNLTAQLSGLLGTGKSRSVTWFLLLLIPVAAVVIFLILRRKKNSQPAETAEETPGETNAEPAAEKQKLLMEIAELDDRFEDGSIEEQEYRKLRAAKKQKLLEMNN